MGKRGKEEQGDVATNSCFTRDPQSEDKCLQWGS